LLTVISVRLASPGLYRPLLHGPHGVTVRFAVGVTLFVPEIVTVVVLDTV
jgi:hypothetical protein